MRFLTILFFIFLFFYLLSLVGRVMLRGWIVRRSREFAQGQARGHGRGADQRGARRREGEVTVSTRAGNEKRLRSDAGDYVEYEEIKD